MIGLPCDKINLCIISTDNITCSYIVIDRTSPENQPGVNRQSFDIAGCIVVSFTEREPCSVETSPDEPESVQEPLIDV